jgi:hypothetical protein
MGNRDSILLKPVAAIKPRITKEKTSKIVDNSVHGFCRDRKYKSKD